MAAHNGGTLDVPLQYKAGITPNLDAIDFRPDGSPSDLPMLAEGVIAGTWADVFPAYAGPAHTGGILRTFDGDWYDRIHVIPLAFNLGNVLQNQSRTAEVWNANFVSRTLNDIIETDTEGIALTGGPGAPPVVYGPLESSIYTFTVTLDGPLSIDASFLFDFDTQDLTVTLIGTRAIVFAFEPQLPLAETLEWRTDVLESYGGAEQRIMVRHRPRRKFQMDYLLSDRNEISRALNGLYGRVGGVFAVPVWWDVRNVTADVPLGGTTVLVDTTFADFRDGGFAILWRASDDFEVVEIDTVSPTQFTLTRPTDQAHPSLTTVAIPVERCLIDDPTSTSRWANGVTRIEAKWTSEEPKDLSAVDGELTIYRGLPVLSDLNFIDGDDVTEPIESKAVVIDNKSGPAAKSYRRRFPRIISAKGWQPETAAELWAVRKLLHALRGRQRSFWLPTFREDFVLTTTVGPAATTMLVEFVDYERFIDTNEPLGDIAIYLTDGTTFFREVTNVEPGVGGDEQLTISSALGITVNPADVLRISYLVRSRLDTDSVTITHDGLGRARIVAPTVGVLA
ncbi:MAG: hypothetical protein HC923_01175 [Myxococcales bacterium]|nr:hypothetical protein [Myxococcales bacterium]